MKTLKSPYRKANCSECKTCKPELAITLAYICVRNLFFIVFITLLLFPFLSIFFLKKTRLNYRYVKTVTIKGTVTQVT